MDSTTAGLDRIFGLAIIIVPRDPMRTAHSTGWAGRLEWRDFEIVVILEGMVGKPRP